MIEELSPQYLEPMVDLHRAVLGHTLNAKIGPWFLKRLYSSVLRSEEGYCLVFVQEGRVLGFISFCTDRLRMEREIFRNLQFSDRLRVAHYLSVRPWLWLPLTRQVFFGRYLANRWNAPCPWILTLGVSAGQQGKGIGRALVDQAKRYVKERGHAELFVDTEDENEHAVRFYRMQGFERIGVRYGNVLLKSPLHYAH